MIYNELAYSELLDVELIDPETLVTAFRLLPVNTSDETHKMFFHQLFNDFSKKIFKDKYRRDDENSFDHEIRQSFLEKFAYVVLSSKGV